MKLITRSEHRGEIRRIVETPEKAVQSAAPAQNEPFSPSEHNPFHPGDTVIYKYNQKGTVISTKGDGVQVDFGLGVHHLSYTVLKLSQN
jgi:hypothetical protein